MHSVKPYESLICPANACQSINNLLLNILTDTQLFFRLRKEDIIIIWAHRTEGITANIHSVSTEVHSFLHWIDCEKPRTFVLIRWD